MKRSNCYDMIVVGGGISGLSMAHYLSQKDKKVLVLEADDHVGGCVNTVRFNQRNFWMEMGAHTCYNSYSHIIDMAKNRDLDSRFVARNKLGLKLYNGQFKGLFSQVNKLEMLRSLPRLFSAKKQGKSVYSFYSLVLGKKNYENLFSRLFSAVIVQDADEYAAELFLKRRNTRRKEYPRSFTLANGLLELIEDICNDDNITVLNNSKVEEIQRSDGGFNIKVEDGRSLEGVNITLAVSPDAASHMLKQISAPLSQLLDAVSVQQIHTKAVVVQKQKLNLKPLAFIIPLQGACSSVVTRDVVSHERLRGFAFHFKKGMISSQDQTNYIQEVLGVESADIEEVVDVSHKLPLLKVEHPQIVEKIDKLLENSGVYLTGNFFDGLSLEDCVIRSQKEFNRYLKNC